MSETREQRELRWREQDEQQEKFDYLKAAAIAFNASPEFRDMAGAIEAARNLVKEVWKHKGKL